MKKIISLLFIIMLIFSSCGNASSLKKFKLPVRNTEINWGMSAEEFEELGLDCEVSESENGSMLEYTISSSLDTYFGISSRERFYFSDPSTSIPSELGLVTILFDFPNMTVDALNERLFEFYGHMEGSGIYTDGVISGLDDEMKRGLGLYYVPESAKAKNIAESEREILINWLIDSQSDTDLVGREKSNEEKMQEANNRLTQACVYRLHTGETDTGAYLEIDGNLLAVLANYENN